MDAPRRPRLLRRALLLCATALAACAGLGAVIAHTAPRAEAAELEQAERRWAARTFTHYRLKLRDKGCLQTIEVRDEQVMEVAPNRCEPPPRTVTDLFTLIRRDGKVSAPCIALGCACDDVLTVRASYDRALGFPTLIEVRVAARPNWQHPDYWAEMLEDRKLPDCSILAEGSKIIRVDSITPIR
ncbi:MAG TPA: DUF6174 domain-containing protein [Roseiflexaceae bacterium]|nr:DUF6174 domain-containing protein [Roseiflexaceae bacterium]